MADKIAVMLGEPWQHPGNPDTKQPSATIKFPVFQVGGKPPPFYEATRNMNQTCAEVVMYFIEKNQDSTVIANAELEPLRQVLGLWLAAEEDWLAQVALWRNAEIDWLAHQGDA